MSTVKPKPKLLLDKVKPSSNLLNNNSKPNIRTQVNLAIKNRVTSPTGSKQNINKLVSNLNPNIQQQPRVSSRIDNSGTNKLLARNFLDKEALLGKNFYSNNKVKNPSSNNRITKQYSPLSPQQNAKPNNFSLTPNKNHNRNINANSKNQSKNTLRHVLSTGNTTKQSRQVIPNSGFGKQHNSNLNTNSHNKINKENKSPTQSGFLKGKVISTSNLISKVMKSMKTNTKLTSIKLATDLSSSLKRPKAFSQNKTNANSNVITNVSSAINTNNNTIVNTEVVIENFDTNKQPTDIQKMNAQITNQQNKASVKFKTTINKKNKVKSNLLNFDYKKPNKDLLQSKYNNEEEFNEANDLDNNQRKNIMENSPLKQITSVFQTPEIETRIKEDVNNNYNVNKLSKLSKISDLNINPKAKSTLVEDIPKTDCNSNLTKENTFPEIKDNNSKLNTISSNFNTNNLGESTNKKGKVRAKDSKKKFLYISPINERSQQYHRQEALSLLKDLKIDNKTALDNIFQKNSKVIDRITNTDPETEAVQQVYHGIDINKIDADYRKDYEFVCDTIRDQMKNMSNFNTINNETNIRFYKYGKIIGQGAFGKVNIGLHVATGRLVAIKSFKLNNTEIASIKRKLHLETQLMRSIYHKNVVRIYETFETEKYLMIVLEYVGGGDLLSFLKKRTKVNETICRFLFKQLIEGLKYMHSQGVIHRDIKLDNILIDIDSTIKLCDLGVSKMIRPGEVMNEHCGTPAYIAPEIVIGEGYTGFGADIWSSGVVLYALLSGTVPFKASNMSELNQMIMIGDYPELTDISKEASDLISKMLEVDPKKRITTDEILKHPFLSDFTKNLK